MIDVSKKAIGMLKKCRKAPLSKDRSGASAIEFAILAPLLIVMMAVSIDLGAMIYTRFKLEAAVSDGAAYAIANADRVNASDASNLATQVTALILNQSTTSGLTANVTVNNAGVASYKDNKIALSGTASNADSCYCPTGDASSLTWGNAVTCLSSCPNGDTAGKYVEISVKEAYSPIFYGYGLLGDGHISAQAVVRTK